MSGAAARRRRRLRRRQPRQHRPGADDRRRRRPDRPRRARACAAPTRSSCPASARPRRRWRASIGAGLDGRRSGPGWPPDRPFLGICLGLQLLFEGERRGRRDDARRAARANACGSQDAPTLPHIGWNQVERTRDAPALRRHRRRRRLLLRPLLRRRAADAAGRADAVELARTTHGRVVHVGHRARPAARRPVPPGTERAGRPAAAAQLRRAWCGPPDASPAGHPVPGRGGRPRRQGHALRRPGRRGRSARARRALRARRRRRARLPRHHRRAGASRHAARRSSSGPRGGCSSR